MRYRELVASLAASGGAFAQVDMSKSTVTAISKPMNVPVEGKFNKWLSESVLLEQESVVTKTNANGEPLPAEKITALLDKAGKALGTTVTVGEYVRFERGEGIEKAAQGDFAAEVAKMAGG